MKGEMEMHHFVSSVGELSGFWWFAFASMAGLGVAIVFSVIGEKENRRLLQQAERERLWVQRVSANYDRAIREQRFREMFPTEDQVNAVIEVYERMNG